MAARNIEIRPRIRITRNGTIILGPGKADLLAAIEELGSIRVAARELDMSYMRAWQLVKTMNEEFRGPLVMVSRGGSVHGGAQLSPLGRDVLKAYRELEKEAMSAIRPGVRKLLRRLKTR